MGIRKLMAAALLIGAVVLVGPRAHADDMAFRGGFLTCHVASGWGFIFGSSHKIKCTYSMQKGYKEYYDGSISKFGADIGYQGAAVMLWGVATPTTNLGAGSLAGHYAGATAGAAVGVGGGANVLVGGFKKSIQLQPLSIQGANGLNVAAGVAVLDLKYVPKNGLQAGQ